MTTNNMSFRIAGKAGQGVASTGAGFSLALARGGLNLFTMQDYMSRIRGGLNYFQIRIAPYEIYTHTDEVNLLMAMNREAFETYRKEIKPGGGIIYDQDMKVDGAALQDQGIKAFASPIYEIAEEVGGNRLMGNTAAVAVASGITGYSFENIGGVIESNFARKGKQIVEANLRVAELAYDFGRDTYYEGFEYHLEVVDRPSRMIINGNHAFSLGALASGCRFVSAYPMTPATSIMEWLASRAEEYGVLVKQTEDEIAAMCMAIGANHMGVRAMTVTSGGGFSLMVEALGLAGMTETPVVVVNVQRPGPSTGLATRTEQGDLRFMLHASQGEFPRLILTPGTIEQAFEAGAQAFNLAEKYQTPVIVLYDQFLGVSTRLLELDALAFDRVMIDRGALIGAEELDNVEGEYLRYAFTETGISPRALPGSHEKAFFTVVSDEHGEDGHILEDRKNRIRMMNKRMRKLETAREDLWQPELYGPESADVTFVAWGSTYGPLREAVDWLNDDGASANMLHLSQVWPFPDQQVREILGDSRRVIGVESNFNAQLAGLIREITGIHIENNILKYDGRPLSPNYIIQCLEEERFNVQTI
ncbi:MAG: 2-oxoacid:acceptor oxidoreductase subunit alpha [Anaerolineales bacterium]|nr:2-oxoacid:acceptor oxidoreductase subunit alpha [Anaerolineales bacterium]